jgi:hypothetical protein
LVHAAVGRARRNAAFLGDWEETGKKVFAFGRGLEEEFRSVDEKMGRLSIAQKIKYDFASRLLRGFLRFSNS